uniref:BHLH domain-containing protein n=1 Tax=Tetradesmus obliquus TaxID=3088 RepID=A0A383VRD6_TETOB|eukprot:jgi/Sobl393_1/2463/SZX68085.1
MAATRAQDADPAFHTYDLTLTDRELDDFLVFMEQQTTGCYSDAVPQLPDAAADFPCLQLQPHTDSPSNSEGSESIEMDPPVVGLPPYMGSTGSFSSAAAAAAAAACDLQGSAGANNNWEQQQAGLEGEGQQLPASCVMDISATLPKLEAMEIKVEAEDEPVTAAVTDAQQQVPSLASPGPAAAGAAAAAPGAVLETTAAGAAGSGACNSSAAMQAAPGLLPAAAAAAAAAANGVAVSMPFAAVQQPAATGVQGILGAGTGYSLPLTLGQWPGAAAGGTTAAAGMPGQQQALPQVLFIQAPAAARTQQQQQQQQLAATLTRASSLREHQQQQQRNFAHIGLSKPSLQRTASLADGCGGSSSSGGKGGQVSHSTVEKQRRDRLNSLIDELSDIVPPADPKYGNDVSSVRRPKHVVLSDTINLLKAMQAKLQIEEAEICTLKQQAAAVTAIAAASHQQQGLAAAAAGSPLSRADSPTAGLSDTGAAALPLAPEGGVQASGVLVEQGVSCLFVKVNCRDRKGLLSDVVGALRAFPVVICTAAITTTKDGTVHDVFEVRIEDDSVTPEDIQCAVHMALFNSERARSKRLRQDEFPAAC